MAFELIADERLAGCLQSLFEQRHREVGNADVTGKPIVLDLCQRAERFGERNLRIGPVQ